ncbi:hypothetical protein [Taibaiella koreensis]|uniref:hypothetical protein n=1 Tax=Taibaiella koreensis TaxID=1268548 RepID=UPI0013C37217|nr:hypothetical protein [Taibaiella koreensis]
MKKKSSDQKKLDLNKKEIVLLNNQVRIVGGATLPPTLCGYVSATCIEICITQTGTTC